jgi:KDEL-tailed cysteine endopeptidase
MGRNNLLLVLLVLTISLSSAISDALHSSHVEYGNPNDLQSEKNLSTLFGAWMKVHNKNYSNHDEKSLKYSTFKENVQFINAHNKKNHPLKLGLNKFTDLSTEEYRAQYLRLKNPQGGVIIYVLLT